MPQFGNILSDDEVEDAVIATIQRWIDTYFREKERQLGIAEGYYRRPDTGQYNVRVDFDKFPEEQLPVILVVSPGIDEDPVKDGRGKYRAHFAIGVINIVSSTDHNSTRQYAYRMGAVIRALMIQNQSLDGALGGRLRGVTWIGTRNDELATQDDRSIWACRQLFDVEVGDIMSRQRGPSQPDPSPTPWPVVPDADHIHVDVSKEPING